MLTNRRAIPAVLDPIDEIIREYGLEDRVIFHDHLKNEEVARLMDQCSMAIVNRAENLQNIHNFSTKLGEYLQHAVPVISTRVGEAGQFLIDMENAFLIEPNDIEGMADKIEYIVKKPEKALQISERGRKMADENFDYQVHAERHAYYFLSLAQVPSLQSQTN